MIIVGRISKRHVLLKFYYFGWNYQGYVTQEDTVKTVEHFLFHALEKCCLIKDRESSNYHRCGRTDKGVSAFSQVISIGRMQTVVKIKFLNFTCGIYILINIYIYIIRIYIY